MKKINMTTADLGIKQLFKDDFKLVAFILGSNPTGFNVQGKHYYGVQVVPLVEQAKNDPDLWDELCSEVLRLQSEWEAKEN